MNDGLTVYYYKCCQVRAVRRRQNLLLAYQSISTWLLSVTVLKH